MKYLHYKFAFNRNEIEAPNQNTSYSIRSFHSNFLMKKEENLWIGLAV